ncbi:MAG: hypothetical protein FJY19_06735 [Bacteroidetes bacterium]|nr:hypothetical protein [Bacteroidota bacterium]
MKKSLFLQVAVLTGILALALVACKKEKSNTQDPAEQLEISTSKLSSESDAEAEVIYDGVFDDAMGVSDEVGLAGMGIFGRLNACPTVTVTRPNAPAPFPVRVVLDFGTGCVARDGHFRKGKIIHVYTNRLIIPQAVAETSFDNFYYDSTKVEGVMRIKNTSEPNVGPRFQINVINGKLTRPNGNFIKWNSEKVRTQIEGVSTPFMPMDDVFKITGGARGLVKRDTTLVGWSATILEPLIRRNNCRWIVKGTVKVVKENSTTGTRYVGVINYGMGACDNLATVTINGVVHHITLP